MSNSCYMTEYISDLLLNVFDGLLMGELEIERRLLEVRNSLNLSNEDFVEKYITNDVVRREIIDIFPIQGQADKSRVDVGSEYFHGDDTTKEAPQVRLFTGYSMVSEQDYIENANGKITITEKGYNNIFSVVQNNLLITRRTILREYVNKGVPSFMVNDGKINSKVIISNVETNPGENPKKIFVRGFKYKSFITLANDFDNVLLVKEGEAEGFIIKNIDLSPLTYIDFIGTVEIEEEGYYYFTTKTDKAAFINITGSGAKICGINTCNGYFSKGKYEIAIKYYNDFFFYKYDIGKRISRLPSDNNGVTWDKKNYSIELTYGTVNSSDENYTVVDDCNCDVGGGEPKVRNSIINLRKGYNRFKVDTVNCKRVCNYENSITDITIGYSVLGK